jgi:glycosyltransferase involved in cell wall biosynthesis
MHNRISVVIVTKNEEKNIRKCIESVYDWVDEIIVVDSYSTDKTVEICKEYGAKIFQHAFNGFGELKNFAISKATGDWILCIDADERVTPSLREEIKYCLSCSKRNGYIAYLIPRKTIAWGKWIKMLYPLYQIRLFKKGYASFSNKKVHETIIASGHVGKLKNPLIHVTYKTMSDYFEKFNRYTDLQAQELLAQGEKSLCYGFIQGLKVFFWYFFIKRGFMDGYHGFLLSILAFLYQIVSYWKLNELKYSTRNDKDGSRKEKY